MHRSALADYLYEAQEGDCFYCGARMAGAPWSHSRPLGWTRDHVKPLSHGGDTRSSNVVLACRACNNAKGDRAPTEDECGRARRIQNVAKCLRQLRTLPQIGRTLAAAMRRTGFSVR